MNAEKPETDCGRSGAAMPTCSKCSDADLGRVCPHRQTLLITGEALDNFYAWVREAQQLRSTLADLIAELRAYARYTYTEYTLIENALDRAETRLMSLNKGHKDTEVTSDE